MVRITLPAKLQYLDILQILFNTREKALYLVNHSLSKINIDYHLLVFVIIVTSIILKLVVRSRIPYSYQTKMLHSWFNLIWHTFSKHLISEYFLFIFHIWIGGIFLFYNVVYFPCLILKVSNDKWSVWWLNWMKKKN